MPRGRSPSSDELDSDFECFYEYSVTPVTLASAGKIFLTETMRKTNSRQAGGTASGSERRQGPAAPNRPAPRHHSITVTAVQRTQRGVSYSIAGDDLILDGRVFKRLRQCGRAPGGRRDEWAFAPLAAARGTSMSPTGGLCSCSDRQPADRAHDAGAGPIDERLVERVNSEHSQSMSSRSAGLR